MHAAYRRAYMAQVPGMPCPAWDEMPVTHGPRVAVAVQAGWLAAAREAIARPGGGQEAAAERDELIAMAVDTADRDECQLVISEMLARIATGRTITAKEAEDWRARAGLGDGHG